VLGYAGGRAVARALSHCPLLGACDDFTPLLVSLSSAVVGMGIGNTLAVVRVRYWWEGVGVWAVGLLASLALVALIGLVGALSVAGLAVAIVWAVLALGLGLGQMRASHRQSTGAPAKR